MDTNIGSLADIPKFLESDGTLTKRVMNDLLHPNEVGYQIWWEAMHPLFRDICGK